MAELNELFEQATAEADGLSSEAARVHTVVDRLLALAATLTDGIDSGAAEARRRLELLSARLAEGEQELARDNAAALAALASLRTVAIDVRGNVARYLALLNAELAQLRADKDRIREEIQQQGEAVHEYVARYAEHIHDVETASRTRLELARQAIGSFRSVVEASRGALYERRDSLLGELRQVELNGRERIDYLVRAYDMVGATVQDQVAEVQVALKSLTDQSTAGVTRRLSDEALDALARAAEPLRQAIEVLERFTEESQSTFDERVQEMSGQIEDVTGALERLREPLEYVRHHLQHH